MSISLLQKGAFAYMPNIDKNKHTQSISKKEIETENPIEIILKQLDIL
jgi:hypothetical protein